MQNYQHRVLTDLDETGFGVRYENLHGYAPPHWHRAIEVLLFVSGKVTCIFENTEFQAKPGGVYIINSYQVHTTKAGAKARFLCVHILPSQMCKFVPNFDQLSFSLAFDPEDAVRAAAYEQLRAHLREIMRLSEEDKPGDRLERQARLYAVASLLCKYFSQPLAVEENTLHRSDMSRLEPLLDEIQLHHDQELPLDAAASSMGLNKEYFCRLFKKNMGVSYLQYVYQVRTTAFCAELETSDDPIGEIARRHGFRDPKTLNQYFRELYGCTPSEKRKFFREVTLEEQEDLAQD